MPEASLITMILVDGRLNPSDPWISCDANEEVSGRSTRKYNIEPKGGLHVLLERTKGTLFRTLFCNTGRC